MPLPRDRQASPRAGGERKASTPPGGPWRQGPPDRRHRRFALTWRIRRGSGATTAGPQNHAGITCPAPGVVTW